MKYFIGKGLYFIIGFYILLLTVRVLISWINLPPNSFTMWICKTTDPVLDFFRKKFPIRFGVFDLSIIVPITILLVLGKVVSDFMITELYEPRMIINAWYLIGLLLFVADIIIGFVISIYIIVILIILIFTLFGQSGGYNQTLSYFYAVINPMIKYTGKFVKLKSPHQSEILSLALLLLFFIILNILKTKGLDFLGDFVNMQMLDVNIHKTSVV